MTLLKTVGAHAIIAGCGIARLVDEIFMLFPEPERESIPRSEVLRQHHAFQARMCERQEYAHAYLGNEERSRSYRDSAEYHRQWV